MNYLEYAGKFGVYEHASFTLESTAKSFELFVNDLDAEQIERLTSYGDVKITGSNGGRYTLLCQGNISVWRLLNDGEAIESNISCSPIRRSFCMCVFPSRNNSGMRASIPIFDHYFVLKFMIEHFEEDVLRIAHY